MIHTPVHTGPMIRSGLVLVGILGASFAGAGAAQAAGVEPDLVVTGGAQVVELGEISPGRLVSSGVGNKGLLATARTDARFTLRPVARITVNGMTAYINRPGTTTVTVDGSTPAMGPLGTARPSAVLEFGRFVPGLTEVTVCVDLSQTVREASETNNCAKEIRTL